ncbi:MAG: lasso RiPP family leader peptide-containing protein [Microbacteriaceae bacterium]|nr:MAG: lasso RiPP family leader peptide-containing protein [Microbacteriaceae bacterium]
MTYEAPKITEAGRFSSTTLGSATSWDNADNTWFWPTSNPGSR